MTAGTADAVRRAVEAVVDPELRRPIGELDMVRDISVDGGVAHVGIVLTIVGLPRRRPHLARGARGRGIRRPASRMSRSRSA